MSQVPAPDDTRERADVLIVTAVKDEYDAVLQVGAGAWPNSRWEVKRGPLGLDVAFRDFTTNEGERLRIAVTQAPGMGASIAANAAVPLVRLYEPRCLAMCGVCAGRRGKVELGDVILADRVWFYEAGKRKTEVDEQGRRHERFEPDPSPSLLDFRWQQQAERFFSAFPKGDEGWLSLRPRPYQAQENWLLEQVLLGEDPSKHPDRRLKCAQYPEVVQRLWARGLLRRSMLEFTKKGRKYIEEQRLLYPDGLPEPQAFKVHIGPMASGSAVIQDPKIIDAVSEQSRKLLAIEMESAAIGDIARLQGVPLFLVMKAAMDYADGEKNDHFKSFAARASAECLLAFLRAYPPPPVPPEPPKARPAPVRQSPPPEEEPDELLEPGTAPRPTDPSPAALLDARHGYVPFFEAARKDALDELERLCEAPEPAAALLIYGPGGMGKTRLLIEVCARLREKGWQAGFLAAAIKPERIEALCTGERPTLIVIDYAESRPWLTDLLRPVARQARASTGAPLRVVLLARNAGDWWSYVKSSESPLQDLLSARLPLALSSLAPSGEARIEVFREAVRAFAALVGRAQPESPEPSLEDPCFERMLYVHMAALATVEGIAFTADTLMDRVLDHEERFWLHRVKHHFSEDAEGRRFCERARRGVVALTLRGGSRKRAEVEALFERVGLGGNDALIDLFRDLYGGEGGKGRFFIRGLEPDPLGEAMVRREFAVLEREGESVTGFVEQVFEAASEASLQKGFEVLGCLSEDDPEAMGHLIAHLLEQDLPGRALAAFEAAKAIGERTAHARLGMVLARALARGGDAELARRIESAGIPEHTVSLGEVAVWVFGTLAADLLLEDADSNVLAERTRLLNRLTAKQSKLGQPREALASALEAVAICHKLLEQSPQFLPQLAKSLTNLGLIQRELGQREAALASIQEAMEIHRKLFEEHPGASLPHLATNLWNLGLIQSTLGQREAALASTQEAVNYYLRLSDERPEAFLPDLAGSLTNLGVVQRELGQRQAALDSTQRAVKYYHHLSKQRPEAFLPELASSLTNLSLMLGELGQQEEASAAAREAVEYYRKLSEQRRSTFLPYLASSLNNLSLRQSELGQWEAALASTQEAAKHYHELSAQRPEVFLPDLATSLTNLAIIQDELGQHIKALDSSREALDSIWPSFLKLPQAFDRRTGYVLQNVLKQLIALNQQPDEELNEKIAEFQRWHNR